MQKVAQKRKAEPKHRHPNSRQLPIFISSDGFHESAAEYKQIQVLNMAERPSQTKPECVYIQTDALRLQTPSSTYSAVLAKTNLHFLDLSLLTSVGVGRYTGQKLLESPQTIAHFFTGRNWSYFQYIPLYYQQSVLIRSATDCVLARVRCLLTPDDKNWELFALSAYSRALSQLQDAMDSTSQRLTAELLCATQMLGLYEVSVTAFNRLWRTLVNCSLFPVICSASKPQSRRCVDKAYRRSYFFNSVTRSTELSIRVRKMSVSGLCWANGNHQLVAILKFTQNSQAKS